MNRLQKLYQDKVIPKLKKAFKLDNDLACPKIEKIIINMGIGDVSKDKTNREKVINYITHISGQKPLITQAKKAISEFSIRKNDPVGLKTTLRGQRMYQFLDKLISIVLPKVRDFQGVSIKAFDENGNYNLGLKEQIIFPEVEYDKIDRIRGLQITIKIKNTDKEKSYQLLKLLGMPFEKNQN